MPTSDHDVEGPDSGGVSPISENEQNLKSSKKRERERERGSEREAQGRGGDYWGPATGTGNTARERERNRDRHSGSGPGTSTGVGGQNQNQMQNTTTRDRDRHNRNDTSANRDRERERTQQRQKIKESLISSSNRGGGPSHERQGPTGGTAIGKSPRSNNMYRSQQQSSSDRQNDRSKSDHRTDTNYIQNSSSNRRNQYNDHSSEYYGASRHNVRDRSDYQMGYHGQRRSVDRNRERERDRERDRDRRNRESQYYDNRSSSDRRNNQYQNIQNPGSIKYRSNSSKNTNSMNQNNGNTSKNANKKGIDTNEDQIQSNSNDDDDDDDVFMDDIEIDDDEEEDDEEAHQKKMEERKRAREAIQAKYATQAQSTPQDSSDHNMGVNTGNTSTNGKNDKQFDQQDQDMNDLGSLPLSMPTPYHNSGNDNNNNDNYEYPESPESPSPGSNDIKIHDNGGSRSPSPPAERELRRVSGLTSPGNNNGVTVSGNVNESKMCHSRRDSQMVNNGSNGNGNNTTTKESESNNAGDRHTGITKQSSRSNGSNIERNNSSNGPNNTTSNRDSDDIDNSNMFQRSFVAQKTAGIDEVDSSVAEFGGGKIDYVNSEGFYKIRMYEVMNNKYRVISDVPFGQGVFSVVAKAVTVQDRQDSKNQTEVAIKVIRASEMMNEKAKKEIEVLKLLNNKRPHWNSNSSTGIVKLLDSFIYREMHCLVFEAYLCNLREGLKKFGRKQPRLRGVSLSIAMQWTEQFINGLRHMHRHGITHADIKPENILVNNPSQSTRLKICDLGSALSEHNEYVPETYLASRWYRAPEVILESKYHHPIDCWAAGCTIFEILRNDVLFKGNSNNDQLKKIMDRKGKLSIKMIRSGESWKNHFDPESMDFVYNGNKILSWPEKASQGGVIQELLVSSIVSSEMLAQAAVLKVKGQSQKEIQAKEQAQTYIDSVKNAADLVHQLTTLDPTKRLTAEMAVKHPFLVRNVQKESGGHKNTLTVNHSQTGGGSHNVKHSSATSAGTGHSTGTSSKHNRHGTTGHGSSGNDHHHKSSTHKTSSSKRQRD